MGEPGRTFHTRLPPGPQRRLEALHARHFAGLPVGTILKLLVLDQLSKDEAELVAIIAERIRCGAQAEHAEPP
ncbi:MAG: hypothetical protein AMXMBFR7_47340 [Planctomycetota bacterium]